MSYSRNDNKFIRTVPDESELVTKRVERIDASTLNALGDEGAKAV